MGENKKVPNICDLLLIQTKPTKCLRVFCLDLGPSFTQAVLGIVESEESVACGLKGIYFGVIKKSFLWA